MPNTYHTSCRVERRFVRTYSNLIEGNIVDYASETVTEPCGVPLFSDAWRETGVCKSCASGWTHEQNFATEK